MGITRYRYRLIRLNTFYVKYRQRQLAEIRSQNHIRSAEVIHLARLESVSETCVRCWNSVFGHVDCSLAEQLRLLGLSYQAYHHHHSTLTYHNRLSFLSSQIINRSPKRCVRSRSHEIDRFDRRHLCWRRPIGKLCSS